MTSMAYINWTICGCLGFAIAAVISHFQKKIQKTWIRVLIFILKVLVVCGLAVSLIALASPFLWHTCYALSGIYIGMLSACFSDIFVFIYKWIKKDEPAQMRIISLAVITVIVFAYGTINMQTIQKDELTYTSDKLQESHTFVFLSDLHYGSSQSQKTVENAFREIHELKPDFIVLGGDIVDEFTEKEEMEWVFAQIADSDIPVYYIYGNHDRQERGDYIGGAKYTEKELADTITKNNITILQDSFVKIGDDLVLLGREDPSNAGRKAVKDLEAWPKDRYVISIEHTPYQNDDIIETDANLQLSGHTHAGQYFPLRTFYSLAGLNTVGKYHIGNTDLYVSPGITGWHMPFRNESHCAYQFVTLQPQS